MTTRNADYTCMPIARAGRTSRLWPRVVASLILATALSDCAMIDDLQKPMPRPIAKPQPPVAQSAPAHAPQVVTATAVVKQKLKPPAHEGKEQEKVAMMIDPDALIGLDPQGVEKLLGAPVDVSKGDPSLVWTYSGLGCSFQVIFYPDIKTAAFHALKYMDVSDSDPKIENSRACVRNILTAKNNGPS
jgi:hypothetical protein